jgi:hypothetical protein
MSSSAASRVNLSGVVKWWSAPFLRHMEQLQAIALVGESSSTV